MDHMNYYTVLSAPSGASLLTLYLASATEQALQGLQRELPGSILVSV